MDERLRQTGRFLREGPARDVSRKPETSAREHPACRVALGEEIARPVVRRSAVPLELSFDRLEPEREERKKSAGERVDEAARRRSSDVLQESAERDHAL